MSEAPWSQADENTFSVTTLLKYMGNDDKALAVVAKIVRDACAPGLTPLEQARAAIDGGRYTEAAKIFHGLRGSVGTLGAKRFVAAALALEQAMVDGALAQVPGLLDEVTTAYKSVLEHAAQWLARHAPPADAPR